MSAFNAGANAGDASAIVARVGPNELRYARDGHDDA
jgi:hypothetical protein